MEFYRYTYKRSPRWNGIDSLDGKTIIIYMEQGLGDQIHFFRYVLTLVNQFKCKAIIHCSASLIKLFQLTLKKHKADVEFLDKEISTLPKHDFHVLVMDLPFCETIKENTQFPYLLISQKDDLGTDQYKIGICWEVGLKHNYAIRSCPLKHFKSLNQFGRLFCLQKSINDTKSIDGCEDLDLYSVPINDFVDTAKLINSVDVVVTVDTSVAHVAGALNKPTILLLSKGGDTRFELDGGIKTRWYPSFTVVKNNSTWDDVFVHVTKLVSEQKTQEKAG